MVNNTSEQSDKARAKALRVYLREQGVSLTHSQCLEAVARMQGAKDWNTLVARHKETPTLVFSANNHHVESCGVPKVPSEERLYRSYFENSLGEQAVFVWDREARKGELHVGDAGWDRPFLVDASGKHGAVLDNIEAMWLASCLGAVDVLKPSSMAPGTLLKVSNLGATLDRLPAFRELTESRRPRARRSRPRE